MSLDEPRYAPGSPHELGDTVTGCTVVPPPPDLPARPARSAGAA